MKLQIIFTGGYLLALGTKGVTKAKWVYDYIKLMPVLRDVNHDILPNWQVPIHAHLPIEDSPVLDGIIFLPPTSQELKKLMFSFEDIKEAWRYGYTHHLTLTSPNLTQTLFELLKEKPFLPKEFECTMTPHPIAWEGVREYGSIMSVEIRDGKYVLMGNYIY